MDRQHYNRLKVVLAEKEKTGTWLSEQMGRNIGTVSRWMTNKVQPSVEQLYDIAKYLDVDVRELLVATKYNLKRAQLWVGDLENISKLRLV